MKRTLQPRDALGGVSLVALTVLLYTAGGSVSLLFGLTAALAWLFGPPLFAFVLGQAGVAAFAPSMSLPTFILVELAVVLLLFGDVAIDSPIHNWSRAVLLGGIVAITTAVVLTVQSSLLAAGAVCLGAFGVLIYAVDRYEQSNRLNSELNTHG